jgi:hypothetical protein
MMIADGKFHHLVITGMVARIIRDPEVFAVV